MSAKDIVIRVTSDVKDAVAGLKNVDKASSGLGDTVKGLAGHLGIGGGAVDKLSSGLSGMISPAAAAGAGLVAFAGFLKGGVTKLGELYDATRKFNAGAGTTWEQGSRLIQVFDDLRVNADTGAAAMGKFTTTIGKNPEVLAKFHVELARTKDGTIDMTGTLQNLATQFAATTDPTQRAALGAAAFGKSWKDMVPVLAQGGDALGKMVAGIDKNLVATEAGAKAQNEMFKATDDLHDAISGLQMKMAQDLVPTLAKLVEGAVAVVTAFEAVTTEGSKWDIGGPARAQGAANDKAQKDLEGLRVKLSTVGQEVQGFAGQVDAAAGVVGALGHGVDLSAHALTGLAAATSEAKKQTAALAKATADAKKAEEDYQKALEDITNAQRESADTALALEDAQIRAGDASQGLTRDADATAEAVRIYGGDSREAAQATEVHRRALLDAEKAMNSSAGAAVVNAEKVAAQGGATVDATTKNQIYRDELVRLKTGVSDPDLLAYLDGLIGKFDADANAAANAAQQHANYLATLANMKPIIDAVHELDPSVFGPVQRASGGPLSAGQAAIVGEQGPELFVPGSAGTVVPAGPTAQMLSGGGSSVTINVSGVIGDKHELGAYLHKLIVDRERQLR